jgi:cytochrome b
MKVWDLLVRLLHWTLVGTIAAAWFTAERWNDAHACLGYVALGAVALRLIWGRIGSRYARFSQFVRGPQTMLSYLKHVIRRDEPRHIGHNPLGGWMILALLTCILSVGFTGWLSTTDEFWGYEWLQNLHANLAWLLLGLVAVHLGGVVFTSLRHRENLVLSMLTGRKRTPNEHDVA